MATQATKYVFVLPCATQAANNANNDNNNNNGRIHPTFPAGTLRVWIWHNCSSKFKLPIGDARCHQVCSVPLQQSVRRRTRPGKILQQKAHSQIKLWAIWNSSSSVYKCRCTQELFLLVIYNSRFKKVRNPKHSTIKQLRLQKSLNVWRITARSNHEYFVVFFVQTLV